MAVADAFQALQPYRDAIAAIESRGSGDYSALGPLTKGDRAYGRYQVMGANIPQWSQEALGRTISPQEFLNDPAAQDTIFNTRFGGYLKNHSPQDAASIWFTGRPVAQGGSARDVTGTSGNQYAAKFNKELGATGSNSAPLAKPAAQDATAPVTEAGAAPSPPQSALGDTLAALAASMPESSMAALATPRAPTARKGVPQSIVAQDQFQGPSLADLLMGQSGNLVLRAA